MNNEVENLSTSYFYFDRKMLVFTKENLERKSKLFILEPSTNYKNENILLKLNENLQRSEYVSSVINNQPLNSLYTLQSN